MLDCPCLLRESADLWKALSVRPDQLAFFIHFWVGVFFQLLNEHAKLVVGGTKSNYTIQ